MKSRTLNKSTLLAAAMMFVALGSAKADGIDLAQVLHGGPTCDHVINLMLRHGVNTAITGPLPTSRNIRHLVQCSCRQRNLAIWN